MKEAGIGEENKDYFDSFESLELAREVYEKRGIAYHDG